MARCSIAWKSAKLSVRSISVVADDQSLWSNTSFRCLNCTTFTVVLLPRIFRTGPQSVLLYHLNVSLVASTAFTSI